MPMPNSSSGKIVLLSLKPHSWDNRFRYYRYQNSIIFDKLKPRERVYLQQTLVFRRRLDKEVINLS